jgi:hypothetical protein
MEATLETTKPHPLAGHPWLVLSTVMVGELISFIFLQTTERAEKIPAEILTEAAAG